MQPPPQQAQSFHLLRMQFVFFLYRFVYKTTAMPNLKKKRSVIYPSLNDLLDARNAIQPRRKERSSAECAAATLCLPISACQITYNVVPTSYIAMQESCITKVMHNFLHTEPCMTKVIPGTLKSPFHRPWVTPFRWICVFP